MSNNCSRSNKKAKRGSSTLAMIVTRGTVADCQQYPKGVHETPLAHHHVLNSQLFSASLYRRESVISTSAECYITRPVMSQVWRFENMPVFVEVPKVGMLT